MKQLNVFFYCLLGMIATEPARATPKPNIVVILMDDVGYGDIGPFGSKVNRTPNLDRMAAEGMKLTSFYSAPVCSAARAQLMTGCYSKRVSIDGVLFPVSSTGLNPEETTIAEVLKQQEYATMMVGKWHLGDQAEFLPTRQGFEHFFGIPYSNDMDGPSEPGSGSREATRPPLPLLRDETVIEAPPVQHSLTERFTEESLGFIRAHREKPFFLYLAHIATHVPLEPGKAFLGKSANGSYGDWIQETDWSVGRILDTLRELKLDDRTLVIFTSDNGPWLSKRSKAGVATPLRGGKFSCWEGGIRVPAIAWMPGRVPAGSVSDAVASTMDLLPTAATLAGGKPPSDHVIDGVDLWPLLSGKSTDSPHEALAYWEGQALAALRLKDWKLLIRPQKEMEQAKLETGPDPGDFKPRLYDLGNDPGETTDIADQHPDIVQRLQEHIHRIAADLGLKGGKAPGIRPAGRVTKPVPLVDHADHDGG